MKTVSATDIDQLRRMMSDGTSLQELKIAEFTAHHCRKAGYDIRKLGRMGFPLDQLVRVYKTVELRRAGYSPRALRTFINGRELREAGYTSMDMKLAGFTVRELLNFGYPENQVRTAGSSTNELLREGLSRQTVDNTKSSR
jgi:hypothetical protein